MKMKKSPQKILCFLFYIPLFDFLKNLFSLSNFLQITPSPRFMSQRGYHRIN